MVTVAFGTGTYTDFESAEYTAMSAQLANCTVPFVVSEEFVMKVSESVLGLYTRVSRSSGLRTANVNELPTVIATADAGETPPGVVTPVLLLVAV